MRILCDENVHPALATVLLQAGHHVVRVRDELDAGFGDDDIMDFACRERLLVLTNDSDFLGRDHFGVLFLNEQQTPPSDLRAAVETITEQYSDSDVRGQEIHVPDGWV